MPVVGSSITVDLHVTEDTDLDSLQAVVRQDERIRPDLAQRLCESVEAYAAETLDENDVGPYGLSVDATLVRGRQPGAPRERIAVEFDVDGEKPVLAAVDDAVGAPERAQLADAVEALMADVLSERGLADGADVIVSVPPIQFR
jgi:hypothetical protein